jgi:hypothetical protein
MGSFRVVSRRQIQYFPSSSTFYAPGSIPGSSTKKVLVRAKTLGQFSSAITMLG